MKKPHVRSFRYSDQVAAALEAQEGGNLNDKFERLILLCCDRLPAMEARIKGLDQRIAERLSTLRELDSQIVALRRLSQDMDTASRYLEQVSAGAAALIEKYRAAQQ